LDALRKNAGAEFVGGRDMPRRKRKLDLRKNREEDLGGLE
jgi:hypothetical protein